MKATLKGAPVGKLDVLGIGIEDAQISVDGKVLCERGPCLQERAAGRSRRSLVTRPGYKPYQRRDHDPGEDRDVDQGRRSRPSRAAATRSSRTSSRRGFGGGGIYLGLQANKLHDELKNEIDAGMPPPDSNDPRFLRGKIYAIAADAAFALAGITALTAIYYTFRDKGPPSTGADRRPRARARSRRSDPGTRGVGMGGALLMRKLVLVDAC